MCVNVIKVGQGHRKSFLVHGLYCTYNAAKYEVIFNEPTLWWHFSLPKLGATLHAHISKMVSCTKVTGDASIPDPSAIRWNAYRKISNTIRTIFTKNRGPEAGVRIIHLN